MNTETKLGCRKLHNEELHNQYSPPNIIQMIILLRVRWAGYVTRMWAKRNAYRVLVRKSEGKGPLVRPRCRWDDNLKWTIRELGRCRLD
jgi:hypothetical protein